MPIDKNPECIYECNKGIKCECSDCNACEYNPKNETLIPESEEIIMIDRETGKR